MRLAIPLTLRRVVVDKLSDAYDEPTCAAIREALAVVCRHYGVSVPRVRWLKDSEARTAYGLTDSDGIVILQHPAKWRRMKRNNSEEEWIACALHEAYHHLTWTKAEMKADRFARDFMANT